MEIQYIQPFIEATQRVFHDFFSVTPELLTPYLVKRDEIKSWDISGVIGIGGDSKGVVVVSFKAALACTLVSRLVGAPIETVNEDVVDTIGEIVNIISGNAKKGLEQYRLVISLPSIVKGENHEISWPGMHTPIIGIPFRIPEGDFHLSVGLENIIKA